MNKWQDTYDTEPARVIGGAGYTVSLYSQGDLRYSEGDNSLTLIAELVDESTKRGRKWLILPRIVAVVYLPTALRWDNGDLVDPTVAPLIVDRILGALEKAGEEYRTEVSDEVYQQASRDWVEFGPKSETNGP